MIKFNIDYLNNLILNKVEENLHLDYKASGSFDRQNDKTTEISKDVSAMANSDGGVLIYGIKEDPTNKHLPHEINPINRKLFTKEWLEQIIQDKIQPRLNGVEIHPIEIDSENIVYVIEIQKSNTAHQAFDKKYYKRFNFQSTAMYDYEIRDILNRTKNPEISLEFSFKDQHKTIVIYAANTGSVYAKYLNVKIRLPKNIVEENYFEEYDSETFEIYSENTVRDLLDIQIIGVGNTKEKYGPSRYEPILPKQKFKLTEIKLKGFPFDAENIMRWEIYCDNNQPKQEEIRLSELLNNRR